MRRSVIVAVLVTLPVLAGVACEDEGPQGEVFTANLSGTGTTASGTANFTLIGSNLTYELLVSNIDDATQAHIHAGGAGETGGVMVGLFDGAATGPDFTGVLAEGTVTVVDSVISRMRNGTAYVNVHTVVNPGGEIRGQIE